jgi:P4 family phage/plasmid primase-like protien
MIPQQLQNKEFRFNLIKKGQKVAFEKNWQNVVNYTFYDNKLQNYLKRGYNYGVLGGFGNLVIIDADVEETQKLVREKLPKTFTIQSNKGFHFYYICKDMDKPIRLRDVETKGRAGKYGDIQWFGKYVIGPNSVHPSGSVYKVVEDVKIAETTQQQIKDALKCYIKEQPIEPLQEERQYTNRYKELKELRITDVVNVSGLINKGNELQGPHPIHGSDTGLNFCVNPSKNVWHCFRHDTGGGPISWLAVKHGFIECGDVAKGKIKGKIFFDVLDAEGIKVTREIKAKIKNGEFDKIKSLREVYNEDNRMGYYEIAQQLMNDYVFKTMDDNGEIYVYDNGIYSPKGEPIIMKFVEDVLGEEATNNSYNEIVGHIKRSTLMDRKRFDDLDKKYLCLNNGVFNIETKELKEYNPDFYFLNKIPVDYDKNKEINKIKQFLNQIIPEEDLKITQEYVGYLLYREIFLHKSLMLVGEGRNGKSTFINLIKRFLGTDNCTSIPLQTLEAQRFAVAELFGKMANLFADLPDKALKQTSMFKLLTGGDLVPAERKFKEPFKFVNYSKFIFSANRLPETPDETDAFFRRWLIITFPNQFEGITANKRILDEITTKEELSGLFNWALEGLNRLLKNQDFTDEQNIEQIREKYLRMSNSTAAFVMDKINISPEGYIPKKELYSTYTEYCRAMKYPVVSENVFHKKLQAEIRVEDYRPRIDGIRVQTWRGISWSCDNPDQITHAVKDVKGKNAIKFLKKNEMKTENKKNGCGNLIENNLDQWTLLQKSDDVKSTLQSILSSRDMMSFDEVMELFKHISPESIEALINKMKEEGEIFEPRPGWIKML